MQLKSDPHIFSGMQRDMSISKQKAESLYDAKNIRLTARDGDTMLSITNEKGTTQLTLTNSIVGTYLGHCVVDDYVILFTHNGSNFDYIYKITTLTDSTATVTQLYSGDLGFSLDHPIETLGVYENDNIQKVYWTDGLNQPRYIICSDYGIAKIRQNDNTQFDFVATLQLSEEVHIDRIEGSGMFAPGVIQYAFSYYNKYGRQSNIFYTSLLHYISYPERGANPEDKVANCFKLTVSDLQVSAFDYLRIYSIHRTSLDAVPTVKRVTDLELALANNGTITFIDNGMIGDTMDPTELLYLGGEEILAETITQKDNTIFFGNLELSRPSIPSEYKSLINAVNKTQDNIATDIEPVEKLQSYTLKMYDTANAYYQYASSLNWSAPGFKNREHYRLGVQFQHKSGKWSEPVFIGDYTFGGNVNPSLSIENDAVTLRVPSLEINIATQYTKNNTTRSLVDDDYVKVRPVVVFPTLEDRLVLTQGILCPTVFSTANRNNSSPFSQSSWFFRPSLPQTDIAGANCIPTVLPSASTGTYIAYRHLEGLNGAEYSNGGNPQLKAVEIQGSTNTIELDNTNVLDKNPPLDKRFYVDQSIVTMHSPDIEWNEDFRLLNYTDWKLRIVGAAIIYSVCSDMDIQVSSPQNLDAQGFIRCRYNTADSYFAGGCLATALAWEDCLVKVKQDADNSKKTIYTMFNEGGTSNYKKAKYLIYPWHRSGSLNNDENRGDSGTRSAVLKQKRLSNLKFCGYTKFFDYSGIGQGAFDGTLDITQIQLFDSDQVSLIKLPLKNIAFKDANISYYGNVDTLLSGNMADLLVNEGDNVESSATIRTNYSLSSDAILKKDGILYSGDTPVRMKYKSGKHLVFGLKTGSKSNPLDRSTNILPRVAGVPDDSTAGGLRADYDVNSMSWIKEEYNNNKTYESITVDVMVFDNSTSANNLTNTYYAIGNGDLVVLLNSGSPTLNTAVVNNGALQSLTPTAAEEGKYYVGTYYMSAKIADDTLVFVKKPQGTHNYDLEASTFEAVVEETTSTDNDGNAIYPFRINQEVIPNSAIKSSDLPKEVNTVENAYFLLGELYKDNPVGWDESNYPYFGGKTDDAIKSNLWFPAGEPVRLNASKQKIKVYFTQGDTWYQRYDCLKTYPFTQEDENQIIEIASFMCESRVNADGRYDRNRGQTSNINMSPLNFNLLNPVYSQHDNFFNYRMLDEDYYNINKFTNQITWSKEKQNAAEVDLWTNITMTNTFDLDGTMGRINALRTWRDTIYCFQDNAISIISFNPRVQVPTSDGVPIEISNSYKLEGKVYISDSIGCRDKRTIAVTPSGVYFVDPNSKELYNLAGNQLTSISNAHGFSNWFKNNTLTHSFYDKNRNDLYVMNANDCIVYSELLGQFTSFMDYNGTPAMFNVNDLFFAFRNETNAVSMHSLFTGDYNSIFTIPRPYWIEFVSNQDSAIDKIFSTVDMRVDFKGSTGYSATDFFDNMRVYNEYQDTGEYAMSSSLSQTRADAKKKFRVWRINIPRDNTRRLDRIRNTWAHIKFTKSKPGTSKMELHDLSVQYFI